MAEQQLAHNPKFLNLEEPENAELRFICEALSLIDAVNNSNLLLGFTTQVRESKNGKLKWQKIPDLFPEDTKEANYQLAIQRIGELLEKVVYKGWITPLRIKSLSLISQEAHEFHMSKTVETKNVSSPSAPTTMFTRSPVLGLAWKNTTIRLNKLAQYQDQFMSYHADFQKENYLPHPDSWKVYTGTFLLLFIAILYSLLC